MTMKSGRLAFAFASALALTLSGCGGGGGGGNSVGVLQGTAATGTALSNAPVFITDSNGNSPCQETSIITTAQGNYTCTLKPGEAAPFFVVATNPMGIGTPFVASVATTTPVAGGSLTVNATPLTTAIVGQLAPDGKALTLVNGKTVDAQALQQVTNNVVAQMANVLPAMGVSAGYNPFTTSITAATASVAGNSADNLLDVVQVVADSATGKPALTTIDKPTPVILATATTAGTAIAAPAAGVSTVPQAAQFFAQAFTSCFALPTAQRVLSTDTTIPASQGGPAVTSMASACSNSFADHSNAANIDFLEVGYNAGQFMYAPLTDDAMTGAQFSVPQVIAFFPGAVTASGQDAAVFSFRFLDGNGNPGDMILVARNIPNTASASHPTNWWLVGDQSPVDSQLHLQVRRVEQMNPASTNIYYASAFESGVQFAINAKGPGSTYNGTALSFARVSGPGLPGNGAPGTGLVFIPPGPGYSYMDLYNKTGSLTTGTRCGATSGTVFDCYNLWFGRTQGLTGAGATTLGSPPPNALTWVQPGDGIDPTQFVKGAMYNVELFYGTNTTPTYTLHEYVLSDLVQPTQAANLDWNTLGPQSLQALDPNGPLAGAQTSLTVDWVQNIAAQQIGAVQVGVGNYNYTDPTLVPRGATSIVVNASVSPLTSSSMRGILLSFRMLGMSQKVQTYLYN